MERKRLVNQANVHNGFRSRRGFRLREPCGATRRGCWLSGVLRWDLAAVVLCSLNLASCADYETAYQQSIDGYVSGQPRAADAGGGGDAASAPAATSDGEGPISYGSGSGAGQGSQAGGSSPEGFQTIGSGASGVILPGG